MSSKIEATGIALICLSLISAGVLIFYSCSDTELYVHKLKRIQHYTNLPVGNVSIAICIYVLCGLLYLASGILLVFAVRIGKLFGILGSIIFCVIFDNPLTHLHEEVFAMKLKMTFLHFVVIAAIVAMPKHALIGSEKKEKEKGTTDKKDDVKLKAE